MSLNRLFALGHAPKGTSQRSALLPRCLGIVFLIGCLAGCTGKPIKDTKAAAETASPTAEKTSYDGAVVQISDEKRRNLAIECRSIETKPWVEMRAIPARIDLDPDRHFAITSPVDVVIERWVIEVGGAVKPGDALVELSSPDKSMIAGKIMSSRTRLQQVEKARDYHYEVARCVKELIADMEKEVDPSEIATKYQHRNRGQEGETLIETYARWKLAKKVWMNSQQASSSGAVPQRISVERETESVSKRSAFDSAVQQTRFDVEQKLLKAESDVAEATSTLQSWIAQAHQLQGLSSGTQDDPFASTQGTHTYPFHAARGGVVMSHRFACGERANARDELCVVADLSRLWVVGELRPQDWDLLQLPVGTRLKLEVSGLSSSSWMEAELHHVGGAVDSQSGAVPFAAVIENIDGRLRPGMLARIHVERTDGDPTHVLPISALFTHDGLDYLVEDLGDNRCMLRRVQIGRKNDKEMEIQESLSKDRQYVTRGAFTIASEALLESEE